MDLDFLQIFLLINVFLVGAISAMAFRHAYAHFKPQVRQEEKPRINATKQAVHLPPEVRDKLLQTAQVNFENVLTHSAVELEHDLKESIIQLNGRLKNLGNQIVDDEMKRYRMDLDQLRKQIEANISGAQTEINEHQVELKSIIDKRRAEIELKLNEDMNSEKELLIQQINTKLSDAIASFLTETLKYNVDLGAQSSYLLSTLEEHKAELIKGISDEN